jgi:hypothetical protein
MIKLTDNLQINKPAPADDRLGVFASVAEANSYIHEDRRFLGLKVLIDNAGTAEEYWYESGITDGDLVIYSSGGGGGTPTLAEVLDEGNTADEDIQLLNDSKMILGSGGQILLDNGSRLKEGTIDAGNGGSKGIAQICAVGYEMKWEAGRLYIMNDGGLTIRESRYNFTQAPTINDDVTKGFVNGSRWVLDNGSLYVCTDSSEGASVWELQPEAVPYSGASGDVDLGIHDLYSNKVFLLDEANDNHASIHYTDGDFHIEDADGHKLLVIEDGFIQLHKTDTIQSNLFTTNLTETRDHYLPDKNGTIAVTSDITKEAVGLGNVNNTSDANKPVSTATQTALNAKENSITAGTTSQYFRGDKTFQTLPIQALANAGSVSITITATGSANLQTLTGHAFTIPESQMPVGSIIQINGMCERIATGSGIGGISYDINGTKRYITSPSGHQYQYQINLYRESSTSIRMMGGTAGSVMQGAYGSVNASSTTATITAGGNIVFQLSGYGSVINDQIAYRFFKALLIL